MSRNTAFIHVIIVLVILWFFKPAKLLGAPRTLGAPGLCPAQLIGCDATEYATKGDIKLQHSDILAMCCKVSFVIGLCAVLILRVCCCRP